MKPNYRSVMALTEALKQNRQFTFGEQSQAAEVLDVLRRNALEQYGAKAPDKIVKPGDSPERIQYKRAGLLEIARYNDENERDPVARDFVERLCAEAARGYIAHESHRRGVPAQVTLAIAERKRASEEGDHGDRLDAHHEQLDALSTRLTKDATTAEARHDALLARIDALSVGDIDNLVTRVKQAEEGSEALLSLVVALDKRVKALEDTRSLSVVAPNTEVKS